MTVAILLTRGHTTIIDDIDADLAALRWYSEVNPRSARVYATRGGIREDGTIYTQRLHRVIYERMSGLKLTRTNLIDHIDNNSLNNRRENLRLATSSQNVANSKINKNNTTGLKGVSPVPNRKALWIARIRVRGESIYLGSFSSPEAAHKAYKEAAVRYFGQFARFE